MQGPGLVEGDREENANGTETSHWREGLCVVKAIGLGEASSHETSLMASNGPIRIVLEGVHPFSRDDITI